MGDWSAILAGLALLLLWRPAVLPRVVWRGKGSATVDPVEWLVRLQSQVVTARDLGTACVRAGAVPTRVAIELAALQALQSETGARVEWAVDWLLAREKARKSLVDRYREQSGPARVSSFTLAVFVPGLWLLTLLGGQPVVGWLLGSPLGYACLLLYALLTWLSRLALRRLERQALSPATKRKVVSTGRGNRWSAVAVALLPSLLWPNAAGLAVGALAALVVFEAWPRLTSAHAAELEQEREVERGWLTLLLACLLASGVDWLRAVGWIAELAAANGATLAAVRQRLTWGVSPAVAFNEAGSEWQAVAASLQQSAVDGAPVARGLLDLSHHWQREARELELARIESVAARTVLPVSLLQLPAFLVGGLLPLVITSLQPLFESVLSTG